ncbi:MAG: HEAT repeat domain-containing protein, partial [Pseudomonadota bacterium]
MRHKVIASLFFLICLHAVQCGGKKPVASWPPGGNPTLDGLYPYDFAKEGTAKIKKLKNSLITSRFDKELEDVYLFAYGRALLDALLYASFLEPAAQKKMLGEIGAVLEVQDLKSMNDLYLSRANLKEPFLLLAKKYPKSPYASAAVEFDHIFAVLTQTEATWDAVNPAFNFIKADEVLPLHYQRDVAYGLRIFSVFENSAASGQGERSSTMIKSLLPYALPNIEMIGDPGILNREKKLMKAVGTMLGPLSADMAARDMDPITYSLMIILEWVRTKMGPAINGSDTLTPEIKHMLVKEYKKIKSMPINSQATIALPVPVIDKGGIPETGSYYPFVFLAITDKGAARIVEEPLLTFDISGIVSIKNAGSPYLWPGKQIVKDVTALTKKETQDLLASLDEAHLGVARHVDDEYYMNLRQGRSVALAVDGKLPLKKIPALLKALRKRYDSVLLAAGSGESIILVPAGIWPNCPGDGAKVTIRFETDQIRLLSMQGSEVKNKLLGKPFAATPVKADVLANFLSSFTDITSPPVFVETHFKAGDWQWQDVVRTHAAVALELERTGKEGDNYIYVLPEIAMDETVEMEKWSNLGEEATLLGNPAKETMESFVLKGTYGGLDDADLDGALSAYVSMIDLEEASTVILNVARCWGGDFRQRAQEALSMAEGDILSRVADFIGDPALQDVVGGALLMAGKKAVPELIKKYKSPDSSVWTGAWYVLTKMDYDTFGDALEPLLSDPSADIRVRALKLLGQAGPAGGVPAVAALLDDPDRLVRRWAVVSAGMLGMDEVTKKLVTIITEEKADKELVADAVFSLGLLEAHDQVGLILDHVIHAEPVVRASAALSLGNMGLKKAKIYDSLVNLLQDESPAVRINAILALVVYGDPAASGMIELLLQDGSGEVRETAMAAVKKLGMPPQEGGAALDPSSIEESCKELEPEQIRLLAEMEGKDAFDCLAGLCTSKKADIRLAAVEALGMRGNKDAK